MSLFDNFHLLRPLWLMAFIPLAYVVWQIWQRESQSSGWQQLIPAHLLEHLLEGEQQTQQRWPAALAAIAGTLAILALAGPTWRQIETPVEKSLSPVVLVTDLSASMLATDIAPNRLTRLKQKMTDILRQRDDGVTAIVAYAGSSHVVAPLTDDSNTLINLVQALDPSIMPLPGSKPEQGVAKAIELLNHGASTGGTIVLATDSMTNEQSRAIRKQIAGTGHTLSILGVGSETGAPIPSTNGALLRDRNGGIIMAQLERGILQQTAQATGGNYHDMSLNNADIDALIPKSAITDATVRVDRHYDSWYDEGRWLTLLLLPLVLAGFRRGLLLPLLMVALLTGQSGETVAQTSAQVPTQVPTQAQSAPPPASFWQKLWDNAWQTPDQQAQQQLEAGNSAAAAALFNDSAWRAEALDRSGKHAEAAQLFGEQAAVADNVSDKANDFYNQANALARAGDLEKSLAAYDQALEQNPELDTAKTNRKIVEDLLKQQQQEQQKQQKQNQQEQQQNQQQQEQKEQQNQQDDKDSSEQNQQEQKPSESSDKQGKSGQQNQSEQESQQQEPQQQESQPQEQQTESGAEQKQSQSESESAAQSSDEQQEQEGTAAVEGEPIDQNEEQTEAWLRRIPDNPGDLLRRKFEQQQRRNTVTAPRDHQL